jgi:hypothetical protein
MATRRKTQAPFQFDPNSLNATLATIIANQTAHGEEMRSCFADTKAELIFVKEQTTRTNGRVSSLERWKEASMGKLAGIGLACGAAGTAIAWVFGIIFGGGK